jgi:hypothetical protein
MKINRRPLSARRRYRSIEHGGPVSHGKRKTARPISTRLPMLVIFSCQFKSGLYSPGSPKNKQLIRSTVRSQAESFHVAVEKLRISGCEVQLTIRVPSRVAFQKFVKSLAGLIARGILKAERGSPKNIRFWSGIPYSRILSEE